MSFFFICDASGTCVHFGLARNGRSALKMFRADFLPAGAYTIKRINRYDWELKTISGESYFTIRT